MSSAVQRSKTTVSHESGADIDRQIRRGKTVLRELKAALEDLEDRRELAAAKRRNAGKPGTPLRQAANELGFQMPSPTAKNLERKFDRGEEVLDYFDVRKARVIEPQPGASVVKTKSSGTYSVKPNSRPRGVVHEKSAGYRKKK